MLVLFSSSCRCFCWSLLLLVSVKSSLVGSLLRTCCLVVPPCCSSVACHLLVGWPGLVVSKTCSLSVRRRKLAGATVPSLFLVQSSCRCYSSVSSRSRRKVLVQSSCSPGQVVVVVPNYLLFRQACSVGLVSAVYLRCSRLAKLLAICLGLVACWPGLLVVRRRRTICMGPSKYLLPRRITSLEILASYLSKTWCSSVGCWNVLVQNT